MSATILKKITTEAKRIRKKSPRTSWQSAVKQAGAKYRASAKKKPAKKAAKKSATKTAKLRVNGYDSVFSSNQMIAGVKAPTMAMMRKKVLDDIGKLEAKKFATKGVRDKRAISKKIAEKKRLYKKLA